MVSDRGPLVIGSRRSPLARCQATLVGQALCNAHPGLEVDFHWIESEGDRSEPGRAWHEDAKGTFTRAVDAAVTEGLADLAVHSMKDMPLSPRNRSRGLVVAAVPRRSSVEDCLISADGPVPAEALAPGAVVGTSSPRRAAQLLRLRPDLVVRPISGNVQTRLDHVLKAGRYDATILASAGLARLGLHSYCRVTLPLETMLPAAAQGALAVQCSAADARTMKLCLSLVHMPSAAAAHAEQHVVSALGGDCQSPIAALAEVGPRGVRLRARVLSTDGRQCLEADVSGTGQSLDRLVTEVVASLSQDGAINLLT